MLLWRVARHLLAIAGIVLLGGLLSATLVRLAPGFDTDERSLAGYSTGRRHRTSAGMVAGSGSRLRGLSVAPVRL